MRLCHLFSRSVQDLHYLSRTFRNRKQFLHTASFLSFSDVPKSQAISSHCKFSIFLGRSLLSHPRKIGFASEKQTNKLICFSLCSRSSKVFSKLKLSLRLSIKKQTSHFVLHSACTIFASILTKLTINLLE